MNFQFMAGKDSLSGWPIQYVDRRLETAAAISSRENQPVFEANI